MPLLSASKATASSLQCKPAPGLCPVEHAALPLSKIKKILVYGKVHVQAAIWCNRHLCG